MPCAVITILVLSENGNYENSKQAHFFRNGFLFSVNAYAGQLDSSGLLDTLLDKFQQVASTWSLVIGDYATWLFWGLVLISMVWTFGMLAMQGEGLISALAEIVLFFAVIGFFIIF